MSAHELTPSAKLALAEKWGMVGDRPVDNLGGYKSHWPDGPNPDHLADDWRHGVSLGRDDFMAFWRGRLMGRKPGLNDTDLIRRIAPQPIRHRGVEVPAIVPTDAEAEALRDQAREKDQNGDVKDWLEADQDLDALGFILDTDCEFTPEFQLTAYIEAFSASGPRVVWWNSLDVALRTGFPGVRRDLRSGPLPAAENEFTHERHYSWVTPVPVGRDPRRWARLRVEDAIGRAVLLGEKICCDRCWSGWDNPALSTEVEADDLPVEIHEWRDRSASALEPGCAVFLIRSGSFYTAAAMCDRCAEWTREDAAAHGRAVIDCPPL